MATDVQIVQAEIVETFSRNREDKNYNYAKIQTNNEANKIINYCKKNSKTK